MPEGASAEPATRRGARPLRKKPANMRKSISAVSLVACPFCREMFQQGEAESCPVCGMALTAFEKLPPSIEASEDGVPPMPEFEPIPWTYPGRGRAALFVLALAGVALFFLPWIQMTLPATRAISGFLLAKNLGWSWGALVAWLVLVPTVLSRRNIAQLRGARVAAAFLALVPAMTAAILLAFPLRNSVVHVRFTYDWALYATLGVSLVAAFFGARLGGRVDDIRVARGTSAGQLLH
jgi:hypothetical protein